MMNLFSNGTIFQRGLGQAVPLRQSMGQQAPPPPTQRDVVERLRADVSNLWDGYNRNAALPLEARVPGSEYASVADYSDQTTRMIGQYDQKPNAPWWGQPASSDLLAITDEIERRTADFNQKVTAAEAKYKAKNTPPGATPPAAPEGVTPPGTPIVLTPSSLVFLGVLAVGALGAAVLLSSPDMTHMLAGRSK